MDVILRREAERDLDKLNQPIYGRIIRALKLLESEPPKGDITPLTGSSTYRARVGGYRIIFEIDKGRVDVQSIKPRGQVYKGGRK
ncbi:hypothetical protein AGMMS49992_01790 [Clostridia bacterium]|nr:hypothetical protein AGMMS49992_01790 [Clostridia bacterium]